MNWTILSYTLAYVGCAVIYANLSNTCGRRNANISALCIFIAFSLGSGFAQNIQQLIVCRTFQGIGGSGLYSLTLVILPESASPKMNPWIGSMIGMVIAISGVLGPVLGGLITRYTTWRWAFWIKYTPPPIPPFAFLSTSYQLTPTEKAVLSGSLPWFYSQFPGLQRHNCNHSTLARFGNLISWGAFC